jgi:hypothetical protein
MHVMLSQHLKHAAHGLRACVQVMVTIRADVDDMDVGKEQGDLSFTSNSSSVPFSSLTCFCETPRLAVVLAQHQQTIVQGRLQLLCELSNVASPQHSESETCCPGAVAVDVVSSELPTSLQSSIAHQLHAAWKQHSLNEGQAEPLNDA